MDAFSNPAARLGFGTFDLTQATQYVPTRMTQNYQLLTTLYRENWIVQGHIGSTYQNGQYVRTRDLKYVVPAFDDILTRMKTD
jgi:hypothetical protein